MGGRQAFIATVERSVPFDIFAFYCSQLTHVGIDSLALHSVASARILRALVPGFESGMSRSFPVHRQAVYGLDRAEVAYRAVLAGARDWIVLRPGDSPIP